jgi:exodeoxyribonuclease VII small subunit
MAELERIVRDLESGDLGLDAALGLYERGVALIRLCAGQLDRAEARLQALTIDETGRLALAPVEEPGV